MSGVSDFLYNVVVWPRNAYIQISQSGSYLPAAAAVGVAWYVYGNPMDAPSMSALAMQYALAGAINTALSMNNSQSPSQYM